MSRFSCWTRLGFLITETNWDPSIKSRVLATSLQAFLLFSSVDIRAKAQSMIMMSSPRYIRIERTMIIAIITIIISGFLLSMDVKMMAVLNLKSPE